MGAHLIICSIVSRNGREIQDEKEVEEYSESLGKVMKERLRSGFRDATEGRATLRLETLKVTDWLKSG